MKAYCINCGSIQPSRFRPGQDAITNEIYEDLCCDTCHFIVATIQDREASQQPSQALELELSDAEIKKISSDLSLYEDYQPESCQADYLDPVKFARAIIAVINAKGLHLERTLVHQTAILAL